VRSVRRILVAIKDPCARALPALTQAARIARACGAHLELFHAIKPSLDANRSAAKPATPADLRDTYRREYLQRLERIAARLGLHGIKVSTAVESDFPAYEAIVRRAGVVAADLIVAGRHSHRPHAPRWLRLADWELVRQSSVPVLLVRRSRPYHHPNVLVAVDPCQAHSKPVQLDQEILSLGITLADALQGKLHAVHAYARVVIGSAAASVSTHVATHLEDLAAADPQAQFQHLLENSNIPGERRHLIGESPAAAINGVAQRTHADIVVMGAVPRSGLKRLFIGNTAERVLDQLPCDLLIVKAPQFSNRPPNSCNGPQR
jgi:universal stress protein E